MGGGRFSKVLRLSGPTSTSKQLFFLFFEDFAYEFVWEKRPLVKETLENQFISLLNSPYFVID